MEQDKFEQIEARFVELEKSLSDPQVISDQNQYQKLAKEYGDIKEQVEIWRELKGVNEQLSELSSLMGEKHDQEFEDLAQAEQEDLQKKQEELIEALDLLSNPHKFGKDRDLIMEIRAGTGGQEASLFAGDLYRMYSKYADMKGWKVEAISMNASEAGGYKEIIFSISGKGAERHLRWESGGHRVQRVPATEASGRIHTSAATVAVLTEPEEVDVSIDQNDLRIDIFRSSGPGGQSVNTTDSAVRITHEPTGLVVICQDERSQLKNKHKAMRVLRARLQSLREREQMEEETKFRKEQVGSGDRSEKIRTYNYPDRRVTDHRIGFTSYRLPDIIDGQLDEMTDAIIQAVKEGTLV